MKKSIFNTLAILLMVGFALSCTSKYPGYDKASTGLYYKLYHVSKDTVKPRTGDWVSLDLRYNTKIKGKDTTLFNSKMQAGEPVRFQLPPSDFKGDLYEGIRMLSVGDSASFIINADSLFIKTFKMRQRPPMIDSNSVLYFYVHLVKSVSAENMKQQEIESLKKYIDDNKISVQPTPSGIYILASEEGTGMKIDSGCQVTLQFKVSTIDGKQIFSSYDRPDPIKFQYGKRFDTPGLEEAVGTLKKGGKAKVIVPSVMAFGETGRGNMVAPYSTLIYDVDIINVQSKAEYEKQAAIDKKKAEQKQAEEKKKTDLKNAAAKKDESVLRNKYLKDHKITAQPNADGLYYIEKVKGTGPQAMAGKKVKVHYTGTLLDGREFDSSRKSNQPYEFTLGRGEVIKGWDEGIAMMKQGGKAMLIVPSSMGYGEQGNGQMITPYSTMVFEVELVEVKDVPVKK
jgi:FKBP-type peptidyl-prolyl cis-trans isomerase